MNTLSYNIHTFILYRLPNLLIFLLELKNTSSTLLVFNVAEKRSLLILFDLPLYIDSHTIEIHGVQYAEFIVDFTSLRVRNIQIFSFFFDVLHFRFGNLLLEAGFVLAELVGGDLLGLFWRYLLVRSSLIEGVGAVNCSWSTLCRLVISFVCAHGRSFFTVCISLIV